MGTKIRKISDFCKHFWNYLLTSLSLHEQIFLRFWRKRLTKHVLLVKSIELLVDNSKIIPIFATDLLSTINNINVNTNQIKKVKIWMTQHIWSLVRSQGFSKCPNTYLNSSRFPLNKDISGFKHLPEHLTGHLTQHLPHHLPVCEVGVLVFR